MKSIWRSLLWKEWREQRWKLVAIISGCIVLGLGWAAATREWEVFIGGPAIMLMLGVPAVAVFVGAEIAAGERSQRTLGFMQALPSSMKKAAAAKLLVASATVMAPSVLACLVLTVPYSIAALRSAYWVSNVTPERLANQSLPLGFAALILGLAAVSLLIWTAAAGVNHVDELRAGAIGFLTIAIVWAAFSTVAYQVRARDTSDWPPWLRIAAGGAPAGIAQIDSLGVNTGPGTMERGWEALRPRLAVLVPIHAVLAAWFIVRLGRQSTARSAAAIEPVAKFRPQSSWLAAPRRTPAGAIIWKQVRESAPLAALGGLAIVILSPIVARLTTVGDDPITEAWQYSAVTVWLLSGIFISAVAGIGLFYDDLRPGLHTFWRSRPIDVDAWFWLKLLTGLAMTQGVLAAGPLLTLALLHYFGQPFSTLPDAPPLALLLGAGLLVHAFMLVLGALAIVLVRQPVMAAMLTFGAWILAAVTISGWLDGPSLSHWPKGPIAVALGLAGLGGISIVAWQALRRDWGWGRAK
jgi:ABC-type transport system involved in multi-copper enzyme maturation permease subunit